MTDRTRPLVSGWYLSRRCNDGNALMQLFHLHGSLCCIHKKCRATATLAKVGTYAALLHLGTSLRVNAVATVNCYAPRNERNAKRPPASFLVLHPLLRKAKDFASNLERCIAHIAKFNWRTYIFSCMQHEYQLKRNSWIALPKKEPTFQTLA